jgi:hypothetical protein
MAIIDLRYAQRKSINVATSVTWSHSLQTPPIMSLSLDHGTLICHTRFANLTSPTYCLPEMRRRADSPELRTFYPFRDSRFALCLNCDLAALMVIDAALGWLNFAAM